MKSLLALIALTCATVSAQSSAQASAGIINKDKVARATALENIQLDRKLAPIGEAIGGSIEVDVPHKTAYLRIDLGIVCPAGQMCPQMMPAPFKIELPIVSVKVDACGTKIIVAKHDDRPVDGALQLLTVEDNTQNHCPHMVAMPATSVVFQTEAFGRGGDVKTTTTATGPEMMPFAL